MNFKNSRINKKCLILVLLIVCVFPTVRLKAVQLRYQNDMFVGITGGYAFPHLSVTANQNDASFSLSGKNYHFGLSFGYFFTNQLALSFSTSYEYIKLSNKSVGQAVERFIYLNLQNEYYFLDYMYTALGFFASIPLKQGTYTEQINAYSNFTGGLVAQVGFNIRIWKEFSVRTALQLKVPFNSILNRNQNGVSVYSTPLGLIFSLEYNI